MQVPSGYYPLDAQNEPNFHLTMLFVSDKLSRMLTFFPQPWVWVPTSESHGPIKTQETQDTASSGKMWDKEEIDKQTGQRNMSAATNEKQAVTEQWAHTDQRLGGNRSCKNMRENGKDWGWWWCILLTSDHGRGPVGDYWGLASFNLAPPPHQGIKHAANILFNCNL